MSSKFAAPLTDKGTVEIAIEDSEQAALTYLSAFGSVADTAPTATEATSA